MEWNGSFDLGELRAAESAGEDVVVTWLAVLVSKLAPLRRAWRARRKRAALRALDDRMLRDIGVRRGEIEWLAANGTAREQRRLQALALLRASPAPPSPAAEAARRQ